MKNFVVAKKHVESFTKQPGATLANLFKNNNESLEDFDGECDDIFPNTFLIENLAIQGWARLREIPIESLFVYNSEGDDHKGFDDIITKWWGFDEKNQLNFQELGDNYFHYAWVQQAITFYEITINNKLALAIDCSDGTSGTHFSMVTLIFQK